MILALRQRHRRVFVALALFLPAAFIVGIVARNPVPAMAVLPTGLAVMPQKFNSLVWEQDGLFTKVPTQVRLWREHAGSGQYEVELTLPKDFVKPDLIVYWVAGNIANAGTVPPNAILLGAFSSAPLLLPNEAEMSDGALMLFSLADGEIVDVSKKFSLRTTAEGTH